MRKVKIINIRKGRLGSGREHFTYANLVDAETDTILVSALIDYVVNAAYDPARGYELINAAETLQAIVSLDNPA